MSTLKKLLIITDSDRVISMLKSFLFEKYEVVTINKLEMAMELKGGSNFEFILIDYLLLNNFSAKKLDAKLYKKKLVDIQEYFPEVRVLVLVDHRKSEEAGELLDLGFHNIIQIPFTKEIVELRLAIESERLQRQEFAKEAVKDAISTSNLFETRSEAFSKEIERLKQVAQSQSTILITGATGTGKSLLAKYIHSLSPRKHDHFVEVHCGAIPESLVESELFGHEKGAFTGAIKRKIGKFELAQKGSIFLDEIGTVSKPIQVRLLQVLQERFIQRVGGEANISLDIRVIAATNSDLAGAVRSGEFREDLFYRLNVFHLKIPNLSDRREDIPLISQNIVKRLNGTYGHKINGISHEVLSIFHQYQWPGNVRELENILERAFVLELGTEISTDSIPSELIPATKDFVATSSPLGKEIVGLVEARKAATESFERKYITELLIAHKGRVNEMAKQAKVSVRQLHKLMAKHSIRPKSFAIDLDSH